MSKAINYYRDIIFITTISSICVIGDLLVVSIRNSKWVKGFIDNFTHGLVGAVSAYIIVYQLKSRISETERNLLIGFGYFLASVIDLDHFLAAKSFRIKDATNLTSRTFLHCSTIPLLLLILILIGIYCNSFRFTLWTSIAFCSFATHHSRDATRRGFWISPFGHTKPIPYLCYIGLSFGIPFVIVFLLRFCKRYRFEILKDNGIDLETIDV